MTLLINLREKLTHPVCFGNETYLKLFFESSNGRREHGGVSIQRRTRFHFKDSEIDLHSFFLRAGRFNSEGTRYASPKSYGRRKTVAGVESVLDLFHALLQFYKRPCATFFFVMEKMFN